jgi:hypothetical protein
MIGLGIGALVFIGIGVYRGYFKQWEQNKTDQDAQQIVNFYNSPKSTFGCATTKSYQKYFYNELK